MWLTEWSLDGSNLRPAHFLAPHTMRVVPPLAVIAASELLAEPAAIGVNVLLAMIRICSTQRALLAVHSLGLSAPKTKKTVLSAPPSDECLTVKLDSKSALDNAQMALQRTSWCQPLPRMRLYPLSYQFIVWLRRKSRWGRQHAYMLQAADNFMSCLVLQMERSIFFYLWVTNRHAYHRSALRAGRGGDDGHSSLTVGCIATSMLRSFTWVRNGTDQSASETPRSGLVSSA